MAKEIGVSDATIANWMKGTLPRDPIELIKFCDTYDVDVYWWVNGTKRPIEGVAVDKLVRSFQTVSEYVTGRSLKVSDEQRMVLCAYVYNDPSKAKEHFENFAEVLAY